tara:strand:- start:406 stop:618 length:213 start_codon:yes stop_codon:yes gene_type:complete
MNTNEIFEVQLQILDRGVTYPLSNPVEVYSPVTKNVKKWLNENAYYMDLSDKFDFEILKIKSIGFGTLNY